MSILENLWYGNIYPSELLISLSNCDWQLIDTLTSLRTGAALSNPPTM